MTRAKREWECGYILYHQLTQIVNLNMNLQHECKAYKRKIGGKDKVSWASIEKCCSIPSSINFFHLNNEQL